MTLPRRDTGEEALADTAGVPTLQTAAHTDMPSLDLNYSVRSTRGKHSNTELPATERTASAEPCVRSVALKRTRSRSTSVSPQPRFD